MRERQALEFAIAYRRKAWMTMHSYTTYWPSDWVKSILKNDHSAILEVIYGGPHQSQPPLGKIGVGDVIFPVTLTWGYLYIMGRMTVRKIINADEYTKHLDIVREPYMWDLYTAKHKDTITHKIPRTCADDAAIGVDGTPIIMRQIPADKINVIRLGPKAGKELPLKLRGESISINNFSGYFRRMSETTKRVFDDIILTMM
jgi:hypothetical protein